MVVVRYWVLFSCFLKFFQSNSSRIAASVVLIGKRHSLYGRDTQHVLLSGRQFELVQFDSGSSLGTKSSISSNVK